MEALFRAVDLSVRYNQQTALNGLSLDVFPGERVVLLGANGSGKSTLLRVFDGLITPESGTVAFRNQPLTPELLDSDPFAFKFRRQVGLVFQDSDVQLFNPTVFDEIAFGPLQLGWDKDRIRVEVENLMEKLHIGGLSTRAPHQLSGGEKKRVAIASVMILDPAVFLLDEPTAGLDPASQMQVLDLIASWSGGVKTVVLATHDLDRLEEIADRCVILENGRVLADGTPFQILHDARLLQRARLIATQSHSHAPNLAGPAPHPHLHAGT